MANRSRVSVIGLGPGDPELITLRAKKIIELSGHVCFPRTEHGSLAYEIANRYLQKEVEVIWLEIEMGGEGDKIGRKKGFTRLIELINEEVSFAYLALGDPAFYCTFWRAWSSLREEIPDLESRVDLEIIPGISSISASSAVAKEPLALGDESVLITTCSSLTSLNDMNADTIVALKCGALPDLSIERFKITVIRRAFMDGEMVIELDGDRESNKKNHDYMTTLIARRRAEWKR
jgi:precorrin-2/cobalt-factor-2 C20-methyltransferase